MAHTFETSLRRLKRGKPRDDVRIEKAREWLASEVCKARDFYLSKTLSSFIRSEPQNFFPYLSNTKRSVQKLKIDDALIVNDTDITQSFNQYFQLVFSRFDKISVSTDFRGFLDEDFISIQGLFNVVLNLTPKSFSGLDKIPNAFLVRSAESLSRFLILIF